MQAWDSLCCVKCDVRYNVSLSNRKVHVLSAEISAFSRYVGQPPGRYARASLAIQNVDAIGTFQR
jgi:hypothetical protein